MKYIVVSDIHLGHIRTPTSHIVTSFNKTVFTEKNKDLDVFFIAGDLFDRLLDFNSLDVREILKFLDTLLSYCTDNNIKLRVLEGTPSHDWQQPEVILKLNEMRKDKCDLKYHKVLDIEYIAEFNKHILYIPDEWSNCHTDIETQIKEKLQEHSISKVDIAILHGAFTYQAPIAKYAGFLYQEDYFLNLVRGYIHIGHYHTHTFFDRIIAQGSLDRLAHGEEESKGYVKVEGPNWTFIENPYAHVYRTINVVATTTINTLDKHINQLPKGSHVRLVLSKDHPINIAFQDVKLRYLDYHVRKLNKETLSESNEITYIALSEDLEMSDNYVLDKNIHNTLKNLVLSKYSLNQTEQNKFLGYISILENIVEVEEEAI